MKAIIFLMIIFNYSLLFSQIDNGQGRYELSLDTINLFIKYRSNDTIYQVKYSTVSKVSVVKNKYIRISKNKYQSKLSSGNFENGKFRSFFLYNNPFKKEKLMEKMGVWKEFDSNKNLIKTIDYRNIETLDGQGVNRSIRLFPHGRYCYIKRKKN